MKTKFLLLLICISASLSGQWTKIDSPRGTDVNSFASIDGSMYAATTSGIYRLSENEWHQIHNFDPWWAYSVFKFNNILYVGTEMSTYLSHDDGINWEELEAPMTGVNNWLSFGDKVFVSSIEGIYASSNGEEWTELADVETYGAFSKIINHDNLLVAASENGIYLSADMGKSWNPGNAGMPVSRNIRSVISIDNFLVAGLGNEGIFISDNSGASWNSLNYNLSNKNIYSLYFLNDTLWAGTSDGIFYSGSLTSPEWHAVSVKTYPAPVKVLDAIGNIIIAGSNYGVMAWNGNDFNLFNRGMIKLLVLNAFELLDELFVHCYGKGYYHLKKESQQWECYTKIPKNAGKIIELGDSLLIMYDDIGVNKSADSGKTWEGIYSSYYFVKDMIIRDGTIYLLLSTGEFGLVRYSQDAGKTWERINGTINEFEFFTVMDTVVFAIGDQLYRSVKHGDWEPLGWSADPKNYIFSKDNTLYLMVPSSDFQNHDLYNSSDFGKTFKYLAGPASSSKGIVIENPVRFKPHPFGWICPVNDQIFIATENDSTWYQMNRGYVSEGAEIYISAQVGDNIYIYDDARNFYFRNINDLERPPAPSGLVYNINNENIITISWGDYPENETSYVLGDMQQSNHIVIPAGTNSVSFDLDTLSFGFPVPFFIRADISGDWSYFSDTARYSIPESSIDPLINEYVSLYPNPASVRLNFNFSKLTDLPESAVISAITGNEILQLGDFSNDVSFINVGSLSSGMYIITFRFNNGRSISLKFLKE